MTTRQQVYKLLGEHGFPALRADLTASVATPWRAVPVSLSPLLPSSHSDLPPTSTASPHRDLDCTSQDPAAGDDSDDEVAAALLASLVMTEEQRRSLQYTKESIANEEARVASLDWYGSWTKAYSRASLWVLLLIVLDVFADGDCGFHAFWLSSQYQGLRLGVADIVTDLQRQGWRMKLVSFAEAQRRNCRKLMSENLSAPYWMESDASFDGWKDNMVNGVNQDRWLDCQSIVLLAMSEKCRGIVVYHKNAAKDGCAATVWLFRDGSSPATQTTYETGVTCIQPTTLANLTQKQIHLPPFISKTNSAPH
jgi:hypothetical protein